MNLKRLVQKATHSSRHRMLLNFVLDRMIPFNKPHGFRIAEIGDRYIRTKIPFKKRNFNHIKGLHACSLATLSEFTTGFLLVCHLDPSKYRIIMKALEMEYHYQGKMEARASFEVAEEWLQEQIYKPLEICDQVTVICTIKIHDKAGNHLSTGRIHWQVKSWDNVKTQVTG